MRKIALAIVVAVHAGAPAFAASADGGIWTDREICRAAVKTYFLTRNPRMRRIAAGISGSGATVEVSTPAGSRLSGRSFAGSTPRARG